MQRGTHVSKAEVKRQILVFRFGRGAGVMNQSGLTYEAGWFERAILACILAAGRCWKKHAVDKVAACLD